VIDVADISTIPAKIAGGSLAQASHRCRSFAEMQESLDAANAGQVLGTFHQPIQPVAAVQGV
jgi:hypothetical protein